MHWAAATLEKKEKEQEDDKRKENRRESTRSTADLTYIEPAEALRQALAIRVERLGLPLAPLPLHSEDDAWRGRGPQHCLYGLSVCSVPPCLAEPNWRTRKKSQLLRNAAVQTNSPIALKPPCDSSVCADADAGKVAATVQQLGQKRATDVLCRLESLL